MRTYFLPLCVVLLSACGGGGSDPDPEFPPELEFPPEPPADAPAPDPAAPGPHSYDLVLFDALRDGARGRDVPTTVYRPARSGPRPLVVLSHGAGGTRLSHRFIAEHLAGHGFIVAVLEHVGSSDAGVQAVRDAQGVSYLQALAAVTQDPLEYEARLADIRFAIDEANVWNTNDARLAARIDLDRVAVAGHSYGAFTALAAGGTLVGLPGGLTNLGDARVDAFIAMSPQGTDGVGAFEPASFAAVAIPALLLSGSEDQAQGGKHPTWRLESFNFMLPGDKYYAYLINTTHLHFVNGLATDARVDTHRIAGALAVAFLNVHLQIDARATEQLTAGYAATLTGAGVPEVQWLQK